MKSKTHSTIQNVKGSFGVVSCVRGNIFKIFTAFSKKKTLFVNKLNLSLEKKLMNCCIWSIAFCGAGSWTLRKEDQKVS
jgi:hypothetical protein